MTDRLCYDEMVDNALRGVVRQALIEASERGLANNHHFYISFKTTVAGVSIPPYLRTKYPEEMTIVVQHQFWELAIGKDEFSITLSFNGKPERLVIPFSALSHFTDPSVKFALQFSTTSNIPDTPAESLPVPSDDTKASGDPTLPEGGAKIVTLDQFRHKK